MSGRIGTAYIGGLNDKEFNETLESMQSKLADQIKKASQLAATSTATQDKKPSVASTPPTIEVTVPASAAQAKAATPNKRRDNYAARAKMPGPAQNKPVETSGSFFHHGTPKASDAPRQPKIGMRGGKGAVKEGPVTGVETPKAKR